MAKTSRKDMNYDYKNREPKKTMGSGSFANLPVDAIFSSFSDKSDYRGGIKNGPTIAVNGLSQVGENHRE